MHLKNSVYAILCILILASFTHAAPEDDRWIFYGDSWEREGNIYVAEKANDIDKLLLYVDDVPFILRYGSCKENLAVSEKYCIEEVAYTDEEKYAAYIRYQRGEEQFAYQLQTFTLIPELSASQTIRPTSAVHGKMSTITVELENTGEKAIENVLYMANVSEDFLLVPIDDAQIVNGQITFERKTIGSQGTRVFQYGVIPQTYGTISFTPTLSYVYNAKQKEITVPVLSFTVPEVYAIEEGFSASSTSIGELTTYTFSLENKGETAFNYDLKITLPPGLTPATLDNVKQLQRDDSWDIIKEDSIKPLQKIEHSFQVSSQKTGSYALSVSLRASIDGEIVEKTYSRVLVVTTAGLTPEMRFNKVNNILYSGNTGKFTLYLKNNDVKSTYSQIEGALSASFFSKNLTRNKVVAKENARVQEITFVAPTTEAEQSYPFTFAGTYVTRYGEELAFSAQKTITVRPKSQLFLIDQQVNATTVAPGDTVKVSVSVKNTLPDFVDISLEDMFSTPVEILAGKSSTLLSLTPNQQSSAYIYEFRIPEDFIDETFVVTTHFEASTLGLIEERTSTIRVVVPEPEVLPEDIEEEDLDSIGYVAQEPGALRKLWDWVKGLFS